MIRTIKHVLAASPYEQTLFQFSLLCDCGYCPGGCHDGSALQGASGRVYRSSRRSLTMQCTKCGLLWTMTVHRIAQVTSRKAAQPDARPECRVIAQIWADWAAGVEEHRGRRQSKSSTGGNGQTPEGGD